MTLRLILVHLRGGSSDVFNLLEDTRERGQMITGFYDIALKDLKSECLCLFLFLDI